MAVIDAILVFSNQLQAPNAVLVRAAPGLGLPQLQSAHFVHAGLGYGDFFAAAVVGAILAAEHGPRLAAAAAMLVVDARLGPALSRLRRDPRHDPAGDRPDRRGMVAAARSPARRRAPRRALPGGVRG